MGERSFRVAWAVAVATFILGCASAGTVSEDPVFAQRDVDVRPRLLHCGTYQAPRTSTAATEVVRVPVVVDSYGRVRSVGTPRLVYAAAASKTQMSESVRQQALDLAENCVFEPAVLQGVQVTTGHAVEFMLPY